MAGAAANRRRSTHGFVLVQETIAYGDSFLFDRENFLQVFLGLRERVFLGFAGRANFFERRFNLIRQSVVLDGCAQGFHFGTGLAEAAASTAAATTAVPAAATKTARSEEQ